MTGNHDDAAEAAETLEPTEESQLEQALVVAFRPQALAESRHDALLAAALVDPLAEPSAEERAAAEELRRALDTGGADSDAELSRALAAPFRTPGDAVLARVTAAALERSLPRPKLVRLAVGVTAALSLAASVVLVLSASSQDATPPVRLSQSRSLSPLFAQQADETSSARLDRIVALRSRELRDNRFATWGVQ
jgi:hypothetical protein